MSWDPARSVGDFGEVDAGLTVGAATLTEYSYYNFDNYDDKGLKRVLRC